MEEKSDIIFSRLFPVKKICGCYLLWENGRVVYVGQSENIMQRIGVHLAGNKKFDAFSYTLAQKNILNDLEAYLIGSMKPTINTTMPPNSIYGNIITIQKLLKIGRWEAKRRIKKLNLSPVWRGYYRLDDLVP